MEAQDSHHQKKKGSDKRISERLPENEPPSRVPRDPRQRVCPGSVNLDKVGIITDLNDKHLLLQFSSTSNGGSQTNHVIQCLAPIKPNADMQLLSIIALRSIAKHAAETIYEGSRISSWPCSATTARNMIKKHHVLAYAASSSPSRCHSMQPLSQDQRP